MSEMPDFCGIMVKFANLFFYEPEPAATQIRIT